MALGQTKALACIIPLIPNLTRLDLKNNALTDEMSTLMIMAVFQHPTISSLSLEQNQVKYTASSTLSLLMKKFPSKIESLSFRGSDNMGTYLDRLTKQLKVDHDVPDLTEIQSPGQILSSLDLSNLTLSLTCCKNLGQFLITSNAIKVLDLQSCQPGQSGTRFIMDGLNRNTGLQYLNYSCNDLSSKIHEFAIKLANIVVKHNEMMHMDLSNTWLSREEVIFIGMALPMSVSLIGVHLSANGL